MNSDVEGLKIYQCYLDLIFYVEMITKKYPKYERDALVAKIKNVTYDGMELVLDSYKTYLYREKLKPLMRLDSKLKLLKVLVRVSYKNKYISINNYHAWSKKITDICNLLGRWVQSCQRQLKTHSTSI